MGLADTAKLAVQLSLKDGLTPGLRKASKGVSSFDASIRRTSKGVGQIGGSLIKLGAVAGTAAAVGIYAAAKAGASFEAQLNTINTIARESTTGLTAIGDGLRQLAREGRGSLDDLSTGYYDILSAGIKAADAQKVLTSATTLAIGGLSTNAQAVDLLTTAINAFGQDASAAQMDADLFAKAIEIGKVTADEIAASFANIAPIAAQTGVSIQEVAAAYGALTAQGVPAAEVTTQMSRAILDLISPNKALRNIEGATGIDFAKIMKDKGLVVALQKMRDLTGDDATAFKELFGRVEGYKFALMTTGPQQKIYNDALAAMGDSAGTASEQMGERTKGLAFQVNRLKANLNDAAIEISAGFLPAMARAADKISTWLSSPDNRKSLRSLGEDIGKAIDSIDWDRVLRAAQGIAAALKPALSLVMQLADLIAKLPPELVGGAATLIVANKVTGGGLAAGAGNIIGGLGETLARSLASKIPLFGAAFVQPVFVTNMGTGLPTPGGGPDIPGTVLKTGLLATLGGIAGFTAIAGAAALTLYYGIPGLIGSKPNDRGMDPIKAPGGGEISGPNAGIIRLFTPGLAKIEAAITRDTADTVGELNAVKTAIRQNLGTADTPTEKNATTRETKRVVDAVNTARQMSDAQSERVRQAIRASAGDTVGELNAVQAAIRNLPPPTVNVAPVTVKLNVSAADVGKSIVVRQRYAKTGGSRAQNSDQKGGP